MTKPKNQKEENMSNGEDTYTRTMKTKAALDLFRAFKKFQELVKSGVDSDTAFLQAFFGVYYAVPSVPRPDYIMTVSDLYDAMKEVHLHLSQLNQESEDAIVYLEAHMKQGKPQ
jgi:hypothetical protein